MNQERTLIFGIILFFFGIAFSYVNFGNNANDNQNTKQNLTTLTSTAAKAITTANEEKINFKLNFTDDDAKSYIKRFYHVAQAEQKRYKIPASITLAQALLESTAGKSRLANQNNNHFGIKCFSNSCKKGHCTNFHDDNHKDFFRKFNGSWYSFREHSKLLQKKRYKSCYKCQTIECWAKELRKNGYATDKNYHKKIISLIEKFNLKKYDK